MDKIRSLLQKETLLLFRDIPGLAILFIMPVLLIFVVTLAQDNAIKSRRPNIPLLLANNKPSPVANKIVHNIEASGFFTIVHEIDQVRLTPQLIRYRIGMGDFHFGLVIPPGDSSIVLIIDPALQETYRASIVQSLTYLIKEAQSRDVMDKLVGQLSGDMKPVIDEMVKNAMLELPPVEESFALKEKTSIQPNIIQNNVPGFILFAMFFIVIPLSGNLITEKREGSFQRLMTLPVSILSVLTAKVILYLAVCLLQFCLMLAIGLWVFPAFFGFPALITGNQYIGIFIATIAASLSAIGFGLMTGSVASTQNQAAIFGSVMVVILGVVSGTFFPVHLMPAPVQYLSYLSPVRWGIDNYLNLFIREGDVFSILPNTILLLLFFGLAMMISIANFAKKL